MIEIFKSNKPNKKFMVLYNNKKIYFGATGYEHYTEGHLDLERKRNYLSRALGIKNKYGIKTSNDPFSPNFWAVNFLWMEPTYLRAKKLIQKILGEKVKLMF